MVWHCEYIGKLKGVGHQEKSKINELSIHTIADLQLHVHHHDIPKVPIRGFGLIYEMYLQDLPGNPPPPYSRTTGKRKICIFQGMESYGRIN